MSEIKALDELREYAEKCCPEYESYDRVMMQIANKIQDEVDERYMLLPVGADGIPIRIGDIVDADDAEYPRRITVEGFTSYFPDGKGRLMIVDGDEDVWSADSCRHRRTIEEVLSEMADEINRQGHQYGLTKSEIIERYADELRGINEQPNA